VKISSFVNPFVDWRAYICEFFGTFVIVVISGGTLLANKFWGELGALGVALSFGLVVAVAMYSTIHISGAHLNPAITLSLWLSGKMKTFQAVMYILFQIAASFAAAVTLLYIFGSRAIDFSLGAPSIGAGVSFQSAVVVEALATAFLVFAYFATIVDKKGPISFGPLVVGLAVLVSVLFSYSISGGSLNPARVVGPLSLIYKWDDLILYIIGASGGSLFGIVYDFLFLKKSKK